jgi:DHA3 family macrolide efflux protein-like MFS transporter
LNKQNEINNWVKNFIPVWIAQMISLLGSLLAQYAIIWWLTLESQSAVVMATSTLFGMLPAVLLGPFVGTLVDRFNRKKIMILSDLIIACLVVVLIVLFRLNNVQYWHIYLIMALRSIGGAFHGAALNASIGLMVPDEQLTRVSGINQTLQGIMAIIAPPLAALLMGIPQLSFSGLLSIDVITAVVAIISIAMVVVPQPARSEQPLNIRLFFQETREGFTYVWNWKGIRSLLFFLTMFGFFFMPLNSLESLFVLQHLKQDMTAFSIIETSFGIGFMAGGVLLGVWGGFEKRINTILMGMAGTGLCLLGHALTPAEQWWIAPATMAICGLLLPVLNGPVYAILQSVIDETIQGRVFALQNSLNSGVSVIALILVGVFSTALTVQQILLYSAIGVCCMAVWAILSPSMRSIEEPRQSVALPGE